MGRGGAGAGENAQNPTLLPFDPLMAVFYSGNPGLTKVGSHPMLNVL
jgi:hypothetical protein